jgi:23S rRNA pseudouridine1911/1915/1917 synthase
MKHVRELDAQDEGTTVAAAVRRTIEGLSWSRARALCTSGRVHLDGAPVLDAAMRVRCGARLAIDPGAPGRSAGGAGTLPPDAIVHLDHDVVVVNKPAGLLSVPFDEGDRDTLLQRARATLRRIEGRGGPPLRVVQRLDKDTSGILVFARNRRAERSLQDQLRRHDVQRRYLALALGQVVAARHDTLLVQRRSDGMRASWRGPKPPPAGAKRAITEIEPIEVLTFGAPLCEGAERMSATLVACRLRTGRQHQIRIHLAEAGHPLVGEHVYVRGYEGPFVRGYGPREGRPMLHAQRLGFVHPSTEEQVSFERDPPEDFGSLLQRLRAAARTDR